MRQPDYAGLDPRFARMRDYLASVAPPGKLPGRQHIDPVALRSLLPFINLVDVERENGELRFRFRLVGTLQSTAAGREISGLYLEDAVLPEFVERIRANMAAAVKRCEPVYDRFGMPHPGRDFIETERIYFPLARDGQTVDMLLILNSYPEVQERTLSDAGTRLQPDPAATDDNTRQPPESELL